MKRIYNKYGAAEVNNENAKKIRIIMGTAFQRVWDEVVLSNDVCPRDAESLCHSSLSSCFAENILRNALRMKKGIPQIE
jgi:hypothetical protein